MATPRKTASDLPLLREAAGACAALAACLAIAGEALAGIAAAGCALLCVVGLARRETKRVQALAKANSDLRERLSKLRDELNRDHLTGHLNRAAFNRILADLARDDSLTTMIVLYFFDLNRFKEVNDTLGHDIGDQLLCEVGRRAAEILPEPIAFARLGGDEFAAILPYRGEAEMRDISLSLVKAIGMPFELGGRMVEVSASVGVAIGDPAVQGGDELLRRADAAMYEVKGTLGGGFHVFDDLLSNRQRRRNAIRAELGGAKFDERFELHYQPIVNARTGIIDKAEALLRPRGETMSGISPALMVSVAEDSGQIAALTEWSLDTAMAAGKKLGISVAVNVSPLYFRHPNFADRLVEMLIANRFAPSSLIVEVTEGVLIADIKGAREAIDHLRAVGIEVYLDDFGTGYSSLSYLQNFELDGMKLDRSFIQELGKSDRALRIIRSMIDFSHSLGMKTVVEGVESEWQARILQLQGCDFLQGFELGMPMPCEDLLAVLKRNADASGGESVSLSADPPPPLRIVP